MKHQKHSEIIEKALRQKTEAEAQLAEVESRRSTVESIVYTLEARRPQPAPHAFRPRFLGVGGHGRTGAA